MSEAREYRISRFDSQWDLASEEIIITTSRDAFRRAWDTGGGWLTEVHEDERLIWSINQLRFAYRQAQPLAFELASDRYVMRPTDEDPGSGLNKP